MIFDNWKKQNTNSEDQGSDGNFGKSTEFGEGLIP